MGVTAAATVPWHTAFIEEAPFAPSVNFGGNYGYTIFFGDEMIWSVLDKKMSGFGGSMRLISLSVAPLRLTHFTTKLDGRFSRYKKVQRLQKCNFSVSVLLVSPH